MHQTLLCSQLWWLLVHARCNATAERSTEKPTQSRNSTKSRVHTVASGHQTRKTRVHDMASVPQAQQTPQPNSKETHEVTLHGAFTNCILWKTKSLWLVLLADCFGVALHEQEVGVGTHDLVAGVPVLECEHAHFWCVRIERGHEGQHNTDHMTSVQHRRLQAKSVGVETQHQMHATTLLSDLAQKEELKQRKRSSRTPHETAPSTATLCSCFAGKGCAQTDSNVDKRCCERTLQTPPLHTNKGNDGNGWLQLAAC